MFKPGDDVIIDFEGLPHEGHIERVCKGWVTATMAVDPLLDYGSGTERLAPYQTVCVPLTRVSPK